jgi:hypothetical protein
MAAVAPLAPTVTQVDTAQPGSPVIFLATDPLVAASACLGWEPAPPTAAGVARVQLPTWSMVATFGEPMSLSKAPADLAASQSVFPMNLRLTSAGWDKPLNEYLASGLLAGGAPFSDKTELKSALNALTITNPANLVVVPAELDLGEATAFVAAVAGALAVPGVPAVRGRGRPGQRNYIAPVAAVPAVPLIPAVPAVAGRPALNAALEFLTLTPLLDLEVAGVAPWTLVGYLAGCLGDCLTQAARNSPAGMAMFAARSFASGIQQRYFGGAAAGALDEYQLAGNLKDFLVLLESAVPRLLLTPDASAAGHRRDARDAVIYIRDDAGRRSVEEARVEAYGALYAPPTDL